MSPLQWTVFLGAWSLSYLAHAQNSVVSASNGVTTLSRWFRLNLWPVVVNLVGTVSLGLVWSEAPTLFAALVKSVPITLGTALGMGLTIQNVIDRGMFMAGIRVEVPKLVPPPTDGTYK